MHVDMADSICQLHAESVVCGVQLHDGMWVNPMWKAGRQQDAQECLCSILDVMQVTLHPLHVIHSWPCYTDSASCYTELAADTAAAKLLVDNHKNSAVDTSLVTLIVLFGTLLLVYILVKTC